MGTATGFTAERMLAMEAATVVGGELRTDGHLYLQKRDETEIDAGSVVLTMALLRDMLYPVGHIYMSVDDTDPGEKFGGTWVPWGAGRVPVGLDPTQTEFDTVEETGGAKRVTLTANQSGLRSHNHSQNAHTHTQNAHTHTQNSHVHTQNSHNHTQVAHSHNTKDGNQSNLLAAAGAVYGIQSSDMESGSTTAVNNAATATNQSATATNQSATATNQTATATNIAVAASDALESHENMPPYVVCYMWKRTA